MSEESLLNLLKGAIQEAVEVMPYPYVLDIWDEEADDYRPATLRSFYEDTWQAKNADDLFQRAAEVAANAAIEIIKNHFIIT